MIEFESYPQPGPIGGLPKPRASGHRAAVDPAGSARLVVRCRGGVVLSVVDHVRGPLLIAPGLTNYEPLHLLTDGSLALWCAARTLTYESGTHEVGRTVDIPDRWRRVEPSAVRLACRHHPSGHVVPSTELARRLASAGASTRHVDVDEVGAV